MPKSGGVDVDHPEIKAAVRELARQGMNNENIVKRVGVHHEVVDTLRYRIKQEAKKRKR
jgi:hypothetical protein